ncbi:MAG: pyridoxal phosphate-dependent aminotransferase family protein [Thermoproteota archaeon]|nr:pyridoxal phosphate-dependent aminotransferase family protein [Thermoproteota archaeon]
MKLESRPDFIEQELKTLKDEHLYRKLRNVQNKGSSAIIDGRKVLNLNSNDYLGLSRHHSVISETTRAMEEISPCSSRLVAGNNSQLLDLESQLAIHRRTESSLVFTSGYTAVIGALSTLANKETVIFSDELNHASIVDACRLSGAKICVFRHNDPDHLLDLIQKQAKRRIVVTEGIFSIGGEMSNLKDICKLAKEFDALTVVDDAHGDFIYGPGGAGVPSYFKVNGLIDLHVSSLSKALGCFGGYVATSEDIREYLINKSRQFIFTSALPAHLCVAANTALGIARKGHLQEILFRNVNLFTRTLKKYGFNIGNSRSQIIPLFIGPENIAVRFAEMSLKNGIFVHPMRFPVVKKGSSVIRVSLTASHTKMELITALRVIEEIGEELLAV